MSYFIIENNFRAKGVTEESYTFVSDIFDKKEPITVLNLGYQYQGQSWQK